MIIIAGQFLFFLSNMKVVGYKFTESLIATKYEKSDDFCCSDDVSHIILLKTN